MGRCHILMDQWKRHSKKKWHFFQKQNKDFILIKIKFYTETMGIRMVPQEDLNQTQY